MSFLLPVHRLRETDTLIAFNHPEPSYSTHILLVPKRAVPNLSSLLETGDDFSTRFMQDLLVCTTSLVKDLGLEAAGFRLIVNGGSFQDLPQLHFHLISG